MLPAKDMYISSLFKKAYAYAILLKPDYIYILSAKHGLLDPDKLISKYNETLYNKGIKERQNQAKDVLSSLKAKGTDIKNDQFTFLAGKIYCKDLVGKNKIENYNIVYADENLKGIGYILKFLDSKLNNNGK